MLSAGVSPDVYTPLGYIKVACSFFLSASCRLSSRNVSLKEYMLTATRKIIQDVPTCCAGKEDSMVVMVLGSADWQVHNNYGLSSSLP